MTQHSSQHSLHDLLNQAIVLKIDKTLKELRLPRKRVAEKIGVDQSYLQKMLTFKRPLRLDVVAAIANLIGVPLWELLRTDSYKPATHVLGPLEVPLVKPELLLRLSVQELGMDHIIDIVPVPRIALGAESEKSLKSRQLVAVELEGPKKSNFTTVFVLDPNDVKPCEGCKFLLFIGKDAMDHKFTVAELAGDLEGDEFIAFERHCLGPPVQVGPKAILGRVIWKMEYYLS